MRQVAESVLNRFPALYPSGVSVRAIASTIGMSSSKSRNQPPSPSVICVPPWVMIAHENSRSQLYPFEECARPGAVLGRAGVSSSLCRVRGQRPPVDCRTGTRSLHRSPCPGTGERHHRGHQRHCWPSGHSERGSVLLRCAGVVPRVRYYYNSSLLNPVCLPMKRTSF